MANCARCGRLLTDPFDMIRIDGFGTVSKIRRVHPEYQGEWLCKMCVKTSLNEVHKHSGSLSSPLKRIDGMNDAEYEACLNGLGLAEGEEIKRQYVCRKQTLSASSYVSGSYQTLEGRKGLLVFTNENMVFMQQGLWSSNYTLALKTPLANVRRVEKGGTLIQRVSIKVGTGVFSGEHHFDSFHSEKGLVQAADAKTEIDLTLKEFRENKEISEARSSSNCP